MALSAFDDKSRPPGPPAIKHVLGKAAVLWVQLISHVAENHGPITEQWNFAGAKYGWSLRLRQGERVVIYMTPQAGGFLAGVVLGEKAASAAHESGLPAAVLAFIDSAPRYAEGRGIRLPVASRGDLRTVQQLVALKMAR
ncbi:MAG: DUF3788 domain-containing protein [Acidobacteriia bacterium]|nr:DUF3788 domain-containing protein [Terriglobia bacterium]